MASRLLLATTTTMRNRAIATLPLLRPAVSRLVAQTASRRLLTSSALIGSPDPLQLLQQECQARQLCDPQGRRIDGQDWRVVLAVGGGDDANNKGNRVEPPSVRTVHLDRVSPLGLDFVMKQGSRAEVALENGAPIAFVHSHGNFVPGQQVEQWRGEGLCKPIALEEVLDQIPLFTLTSIVGSQRLKNELMGAAGDDESLSFSNDNNDVDVSQDRAALERQHKSHFVQILQLTRRDLESSAMSMDEIKACLQPFRLQPTRIECMMARPDSSVMWDRWEWLREDPSSDAWKGPQQLLPH